jgi:fatty-acyl-CoA synthase
MAAALRKAPGYDPAKLHGLTAIFTGGAPHPVADIRAWLADGLPIVDGFGMSEAETVFGMPIERSIIDRKAGSVGITPPWVEVKLVNELDEDCPDDVAGELLLRGPNITRGYWRRPDELAKAFTADGWFRTGDIATRDIDGFYRMVDRKKDMFISGGENVYPAEIEALLATVDGLQEFAVIGVPDEQWGEVGHAVIVVAQGFSVRSAKAPCASS